MDVKRESSEVCVLEPGDFPDDPDDEEYVKGNEIFRPDDDFRYYAEIIRKGTRPIKGSKL